VVKVSVEMTAVAVTTGVGEVGGVEVANV